MMKSLSLLALLVLVGPAFGRVMEPCELAWELLNHGLPRDQINDWACLVEHESSRNTGVVGGPNTDGSYDYGLFQINDAYWCSTSGSPGKDCNIRCDDLLNDDIGDDTECAKYIFNIHGFFAWYGWVNHCQGSAPDMSYCF